jgi:hypothetical protein
MKKPTLRLPNDLGYSGRRLLHIMSRDDLPCGIVSSPSAKGEYIERLQRAFDLQLGDLHSEKTPV